MIDKTLKQPLLSNSSANSIQITSQWLSDLFHPDNIKNGDSVKRLSMIGGYKGLETQLKTKLDKGISAQTFDRQWRQRRFGKNDPIVKQPTTLWMMILENFQDRTIQILCFAAIASLLLGILTHGIKQGWLQGVSIILAVVIISGVTSANNYMKQKQFRKLNQVANRKNVDVTRNGNVINTSVYDLMVGDIVKVETGEILSVDGLVFNAANMNTDQSSITGQSDQVKKSDFNSDNIKNNPFLISGSKVMEGSGKMMVLAIGTLSREGQNRVKLQQQPDDTPLQEKLQILADQIGQLGIVSALLTFLALFIHFIIDNVILKRCWICFQSLNILVEYFIIAVSIVVIAVPEGLPLAVTISLAYSVGKMKDQNNLVRFLAACETMGGANNICTDKTGTLTKNQMTVVKLWAEQQNHQTFSKKRILSKNSTQMMCRGLCLNSTADPIVSHTDKFEQVGNKTQCALLEMAYNMGFNFKKIREQNKIIRIIPFSSSRKKMSAVCQLQPQKYVIYTKGAPDFLIPSCNMYAGRNGDLKMIDEDFKNVLINQISSFAKGSLRTILICYREVRADELKSTDEMLQKNLIIVALAGIKDPLKQSIPRAVEACKGAGIIVRMVTGDNTETAIAIAKDANIIPSSYDKRPQKGQGGYYICMEGKQFRQTVGGLEKYKDNGKQKQRVKDLDSFKKIARELRVLSRSSPQDKYLLASGLKQMQCVVAMTGDGTNDAPALKKADIGFAMGIAGTQVAKEAAGIILLDDNFSSIVTAVKYGRNIFDCIRKFLQFQLTVNVVAIFMAFLGAVILKESPLTPVQMLWVNLIMDTLAALALATQPPSQELLRRMPYSRKEQIITPQMWRGIIMHSIFQMIILCIVLFYGPRIFHVQSSIGLQKADWNLQTGQHMSIFFDVFVFLQVFNFFNARKLKPDELNVFSEIGNNYLFICIVIGIFACQLFITQFGGAALKLVPLTLKQHLICIAIGALSLVNGFIIKKFIPDDLFNSVHLLREERRTRISDVDGYIVSLLKQPAHVRRSTKRLH